MHLPAGFATTICNGRAIVLELGVPHRELFPEIEALTCSDYGASNDDLQIAEILWKMR